MIARKLLPSGDNGFILPAVLSFIIAIMIVAGALLEIINTNLGNINNNVKSQQAFNIAEAGINYYLWHLSHNGSDNYDGTGSCKQDNPSLGCGGYKHDYIDDNAINEGTFTLYIKPKGGGSTIVTVRSIGQVKGDSNIRTAEAQIGAASFASYGLVSDSALYFGNTESASGPVLSNQGIRLDGANSDAVYSANATYTPSYANGGCAAGNCSHPGVWCDPSVTTPVNCNTRNKTAWQYPVPQVNFNQVATSLCTMKKVAFANDASTAALATQANACSNTGASRTPAYIPQANVAYSANKGYLIQLNTNGTYDLYKVTNENDTLRPYTSALTRQLVASSIAVPSSGVIFVEDNVWVRSNPTFHGRVSIGAGRLATNANAEIVVADNLAYSTKNGSDAIGLVSEASVFVAPYAIPNTSSFNFELDGALLAETGNVTFGENSESTTSNPWTFRNNTGKCLYGWVSPNQTFTFYGSIATRQVWTWTVDWGSGGNCQFNVKDPVSGEYISGVLNNDTQYDYNLLYAPPPSYPLTSGYQIISWREVLTHP